MIGYCKHCNEQFKPRRRNHLYCTLSCKTMASYKRNNYKYVSGRYEKDGTSNKHEEVFENNNKKNENIEQNLKGLDERVASLKQLIEKGQKATSGLLTSTLGPLIARISEFTVKKVFWPGSLPATKDDVNEIKRQNNKISEQNRRLIKYLYEKEQFNSLF